MKEEQEKPQIKVKIRQVEENNPQNLSIEQSQETPIQKIKLHKQNEENSNNDVKISKKRSVFQITAIILTVLLVIAIIVEIIVMVCLKNNTDDLKHKNSKIPPANETCLIYQLDDFGDDFLIDKI